MKEYFSCIDFKEEEEKAVCYVKDKEQKKKKHSTVYDAVLSILL